MSNKIALITGITGMDGSHLAELLLEKGYEVHGIIRRTSTFNTSRIDHIFSQLKLHYGDMTDSTNLIRIILGGVILLFSFIGIPFDLQNHFHLQFFE